MSAPPRFFSALLALLLLTACSPGAATPALAPTAAAAPAQAATAAATTAPASAATNPPAPAATSAPAAAATAVPVTAATTQPTAAGRPAAAPVSGEVVVFAASSLTDVFQDMASAFQHANPNARVTFNFGASSQLATQLGQGARADAFASADTTQMDNARKAGAITGQDQVFARNRLVLITPRDNPRHIASVNDLANDGVKFVTAGPSVPIGQYTAQMLDKAAADPAYGAAFKARVMANMVSQEDNVRQVVSKVQLGEADAAVVYSTDATAQVRDQLQIIQVPDPLQTVATYPIAVAQGSNPAGGEAFVSYVLGAEGQATLARWGFLPPVQARAVS
jgi:molybdate transport system substrate-binding protein